MSSEKIKVGQKWKTRGGDVVEIVRDAQDFQPFKGSNGYWYFESGVAYEEYPSEEDLIELLTEEYAAESLRNSILDIRSKREALQKEVLRLDEQEKEAVEKLKEQGFVLYEGNVSKEPVATENKAVLYAEDIEEDMTDCRNWKRGDILVVTTHNDNMVPYYTKVVHADLDGDYAPYTDSEYAAKRSISAGYLKFHSRPVK